MANLASLGEKQAPYTRQYTFIRGAYDIGTAIVPFFNVTLSVPDATGDLRLQRDVILDPKQPIHFNELFQRDVDMGRVKTQIVDDYLALAHRLKFFNALTVVLLPVDPSTGKVLDGYPDRARPGAPSLNPNMAPVEVGPVQLQYLDSDSSVGTIAWDRDAVKAVIVDGQHRFSALKQAYEDETFPWRSDLGKTSIPVLLLVLDERAGFSPGKGDSLSVLQASRSIFIDLNKHAREVSKSRQFLLDDRDLVAVSMRAVIDQEVGDFDPAVDVISRIDTRGQMPLSVIDWHSDSAKFDRSMYLTTIQTLYELTDIALGRFTIPAVDRDTAKEALSELIARLRINDDAKGFGLMRELKSATDKEEPFALSRDQIVAVAGAFRTSRGKLLTSLLSQLGPYEELLREYEAVGVVNGELEQWSALDVAGRRAFVEALGPEAVDPDSNVRAVWEKVKGRYPLAFQVIFQKSIVSALVSCYEVADTYADLVENQTLAEADEEAFARAWVSRFNNMLGQQLLKDFKNTETFFHGSVITNHGTISYSDAARRALSAAIVFAMVAPPSSSWTNQAEADAWVRKAWAEIKRGQKSTAKQRLYSEFGAVWKSALVQSERARLKSAGQPIPDKEKLGKLAEKRAGRLLMLRSS